MILIDAIYVNNGGGKVLLDYLISELEKTTLPIHYLIDNRILSGHYEIKKSNKIDYISSSLSSRNQFYKDKKDAFSSVLCLGNIPPNSRLNARVYTYFHNSILIKVPKEFSFIEKIKYKIKVFILQSRKKHTDIWWLQSEAILDQFVMRFNQKEKAKLMPFYPQMINGSDIEFEKEKNTFLYVSNAQDNKNHNRLIDAFCSFYDQHKKGKLILTVNSHFEQIIQVIQQKVEQRYPIENIGFVSREKLVKYYETSEFFFFPSLSESLGLGLIEGIEFNCKIVGADLPYTFAVCDPSIVFNPTSKISIQNAFSQCINEPIKKSKLKTANKIKELISELS